MPGVQATNSLLHRLCEATAERWALCADLHAFASFHYSRLWLCYMQQVMYS